MKYREIIPFKTYAAKSIWNVSVDFIAKNNG